MEVLGVPFLETQIQIHSTFFFLDSVYKTFQFLFMPLKTGKCLSFNPVILILDHIVLQTKKNVN